MSAPRSGRPVVALLVSPGASAPLRPLAAAVARRAELRAGVAGDDVAAVLASDPAAARRAPPGPPVVVVVDGVVRLPGGSGTTVPLPAADAVGTSSWPPIPPQVRRRWRERLGLAADLVVDVDELEPAAVPTALAVASAARAGAGDLPLALALGCPVATDERAAAAVGATPDDHVVLGGIDRARALAADEVAAARLSRRAAALARARDAEVVAATMVRRLGLAPDGPVERARAALDELGTPPGAAPRTRTADALALFAPTDTGRTPPVHPAIDPARAADLGGTPSPAPDAPPPATARARAAVRRLGAAVLDRVGDRAAAATAREVEALRDELERTRAELVAEIALLRAELEARGAPGAGPGGER